MQLGHMVDDRRPPRRCVAGRASDRPGMDENGPPPLLAPAQQRRRGLDGCWRSEHRRGQLQADEPGAAQGLQLVDVRVGQARRGPGAEGPRQLERAAVPGIEYLSPDEASPLLDAWHRYSMPSGADSETSARDVSASRAARAAGS
jgi:hypothetical protein